MSDNEVVRQDQFLEWAFQNLLLWIQNRYLLELGFGGNVRAVNFILYLIESRHVRTIHLL